MAGNRNDGKCEMKTKEANENPQRAPLSALICEEACGMNQKRTLSDEDDDDAFLSEVAAAAEAHALTHSKRYKSTSSAAVASFDEGKLQPREGAYLAALRADDTPRPLQQQQQQRKNFISLPSRVKVVAADAGAGGDRLGFGADGSCFKCGRPGHWARDCDSGGTTGGGAVALSQSSEPDKACPCGVGNCVVLTANTEKNRGRRFYKCPLREENGGCGFFQWCDGASEMTNATTASSHSNFTTSFPNLSCPCGAGFCLILTAKTGNNAGRQFYRCPANQASSCGFFKWCNDQTAVVADLPSSRNKGHENNFNNSNLRSYGTTSSSSCFKCGKEGHWAKDCPSSTNLSPGQVRNPSSSGSCYKCGNPGHWARDCPNDGQ